MFLIDKLTKELLSLTIQKYELNSRPEASGRLDDYELILDETTGPIFWTINKIIRQEIKF
jgi:hypothetical protein